MSMGADTVERLVRLSPNQEGILFHLVLSPGSYHNQLAFTVERGLDPAAFHAAWAAVHARHEILRTSVHWDGLDQPVQAINRDVEAPYGVEDLCALDAAGQRAWETRFLAEDRARGFDLTRAPLYRVHVARLSDVAHRVVVSYHHILFDAWTTQLLLREVFAIHDARTAGRSLDLPPARPHRDYVTWVATRDRSEAERHWRDVLAGYRAAPALPGDRTPHAVVAGGPAREVRHVIDPATTSRLRGFAAAHKVSLNLLLRAAWGLTLARMTGEDDVVVGVVHAGRVDTLPHADEIAGLVLNTLPMRVRVDDAAPLAACLERLQAVERASEAHAYVPLSAIQGWSDVPKGSPLFESLVVFGVDMRDGARDGAGPRLVDVREDEDSGYPLTLVIHPGASIELIVAAATARFGEGTERLLARYVATLGSLLEAPPGATLGAVTAMTAAEREAVVVTWNRTEADVPAAVVHELVEAQAARTPDARALERGGVVMSYVELSRRAGAVARALIAAGVKRGDRVGLCVEPGFEGPIGMLGVLRIGAAYVPLDPGAPRDRLAFIARDASLRVVLTQPRLAEALAGLVRDVVLIDVAVPIPSTAPPAAARVSPRDLAYVVYTSGTTGTPKGVEIEHGSVVNHNVAMAARFGLTSSDRVLQFTPIYFDAAVEEIFPALISGATVVITGELVPVDEFAGLIERDRLTVLSMPPAYVHEWLQRLELVRGKIPSCLRLMMMGGEAILPETVARWHALGGRGVRLLNVYGPTEATVTAAACDLEPDVVTQAVLPIGRPIANVRLYLLDRWLRPVAPGAVAEIYVGGRGVARGYLGQAALTAERFVPDPFTDQPGARLYRTGDLAELREDGRLVFRGRADRQVKLRGMRIELGEIEGALRTHAEVQDGVVVALEPVPGEKKLSAYVVLRRQRGTSVRALREHLERTLPRHMIPAAFVEVTSLPLTANGKLDLRALPPPAWDADTRQGPMIAPRTALEAQLLALWCEVLGRSKASVDDDFFASGGDSIQAMRLLARVRAVTEKDLPLSAIFRVPTIAGIAEELIARGPGGLVPLVPVPRDGRPIPATHAQARLWLVHQLDPNSLGYVIPIKLVLDGPLDAAALERALHGLVERHEILRTTLDEQAGTVVQLVHPTPTVIAPVVDLGADPDADARAHSLAAEEAQRPMSLRDGPLMRARLLRVRADRHLLVLTFHHAVFDGWSTTVVRRELAALYDAARRGEPSPLPALPIQYGDYATWERKVLDAAGEAAALAWWTEELAGAPQVMDLPTDRPHGPRTGRNGRQFFTVDVEVVERLRDVAARERISLFAAVASAVGLLLGRYADQRDVLLAVDMETRDRAELEGLVGLVLNTLPLRVSHAPWQHAGDLLRATHRRVIDALEHGLVPFDAIVQAVNPVRSPDAEPLCQIGLQFETFADAVETWPSSLTVDEVAPEEGAIALELLIGITDLGAGKGLHVTLNFARDLFDDPTIERLGRHLVALLEGLARDDDPLLATLELVDDEEHARLIEGWNRTSAPASPGGLVHDLFEAQADRTPDAIALDLPDGSRRLTYRELDEQANQLAHRLRELGVGPDRCVVVLMRHSIDAIIAFFGVLKAGGAYVPVDHDVPEERLAHKLDDANAQVVLTQTDLVDQIPRGPFAVVDVVAEAPRLRARPTARVPAGAAPANAAYVIYTSGTTGEPRGVVIAHRSVVNHNVQIARVLGLGAADRMLQFTPLNYDAAGEEIFPVLLAGGTVVVQNEQVGYDDFARELEHARITIVSLPPAFQHEWLSAMEAHGQSIPSTLRLVLLGGERIRPESLAAWIRLGGAHVPWINAYGPTETTVTCAYGAWRGERVDVAPGLDGPLPGLRIYVLDQELLPTPIGHKGRLFVAGVGLARGYLGRPDVTASRFLPDPFGAPGARIYLTGDLARFRPDFDLEILGRIDNQVKLRGRRIELGEIESVLLRQPAITAAVVALREDLPTGPGLVAYVVVAPNVPAPSTAELRDVLRASLPSFMMPYAIVALESIPLTPNGKVDHRALPTPTGDDAGLAGASQAVAVVKRPRTRIEERLVGMWQELLGIDDVGTDRDFFEIGGHSLLGMRLMGEVNLVWKLELPLRVLFDDATIAGLAHAITDALALKAELGEAPTVSAASPARSPLIVPMQAEGTRAPIFCVHDALGLPIPFRHLADRLDRARPFHLIQSPLHVGQTLAPSLPALAEQYLAAIRTVRPAGPYVLAGYSFGAYVAFEIAQRLVAAGERVERLIVLDSLAWEAMLHAAREEARPSLDELAALATRDLGRPVEPSVLEGYLKVEEAHTTLLEQASYRPAGYPGKIAVIATEGSRAGFGPDLGWGALAQGGVDVVTMPGGAHRVLEPDLAPTTAQLIARLVEGLP